MKKSTPWSFLPVALMLTWIACSNDPAGTRAPAPKGDASATTSTGSGGAGTGTTSGSGGVGGNGTGGSGVGGSGASGGAGGTGASSGAGGRAGSGASSGAGGSAGSGASSGAGGSAGAAGSGTGGGAGSGTVDSGMPPPRVIDRTTGTLPPGTVIKITGGGPNTSGMAFLYPYDQTVFPGGILPPLLQWKPAPGPIEGVYVHISSKKFDYKEIFAAIPQAQLELPKDAWDAAAEESLGSTDPTVVELTTISGNVVTGPITERWSFANGHLKSAVYYNTYNSAKTLPNNGAVMRILPLAREPEVVKTVAGGIVPLGPCYSCHSLSANGQMLLAQRHQYPGGPYSSNSFDVAANPNPDPPPLATSSAGDEDWGFGAVFPDGSKLLTAGQSEPAGDLPALFPFAPLNNPGMLGPREAKLFDTRSGAFIPSTGLVRFAKMPAFSPDGKKVVFNDHDNGLGHSLSVMDFDNATNTFSNRIEIFNDPALYPGWPFFTPDGLQVVFALGDGSDYATIQDPPTGFFVNRSNLAIVDLRKNPARPLDRSNGKALPARDQNLNYYSTVSPVAAGGYFWVFFTSRRTYGNVMVQPETDAVTKKIWVAALDIESDGPSLPNPLTGDPSHPPFYLPGQELASGNIRAFATLTPCESDGTGCTGGIDCCGGFCVNGMCSKTPPPCSKVEDKCTTDANCCTATPPLRCIGGVCAVRPPVP
ncbi:MAG TPA: hypothetical protein VK540_06600 [Polyangiaceae bacterium]|nr:hypothetical protein [Polyangiaceae bacterium]